MIALAIFVCLVALCSASGSVSVSGSYDGRFSYYPVSNSGSFSGRGSSQISFSGTSASNSWTVNGMINSGGFYGYGSATASVSGSPYQFGVCISGTYSATSGTNSAQFTAYGSMGWSTFSVSGTGTGTIASNAATGTFSGTAAELLLSSGSVPSSSTSLFFPPLCGSLQLTNSGFSALGSIYLGPNGLIGSYNVRQYSASNMAVVSGTGNFKYTDGSTPLLNYPIWFADVRASSGVATIHGIAGWRPFSTTGTYYTGGNSAAAYNFVQLASTPFEVTAGKELVGTYNVAQANTATSAVPISGYLFEFWGLGQTGSGILMSGSMYNGKFEVSSAAGGSFAEYITGSYMVSSSGSSGGSAYSGSWYASGNFYNMGVNAQGFFGNAGYWYATSINAYCSMVSTSSCSADQCTMPSLASTTTLGKMKACGSISGSSHNTFSGSGVHMGHPYTITDGIFLLNKQVQAKFKMGLLEINLKGIQYGGSFTLSGSGPGTYFFSAYGLRINEAWSLTSGYIKG